MRAPKEVVEASGGFPVLAQVERREEVVEVVRVMGGGGAVAAAELIFKGTNGAGSRSGGG